MFAPLVAKPNAVQCQRSTLRAQQSSQSSVSQAHMIQQSLRQSGDAPGLAQRASAIRDAPDDVHEKKNNAALTAVHAAAPSWDFSKIPIFSPDSTERFQNPSAFSAPRLPLPIQAKLKIGSANDPLEQEADSVADKVMRTPASTAHGLPQISPKCADCEEEQEKFQRKAAGPRGIAAEAPAIVHQVLGSPGQPLDAATRAYFEPRFGKDFSEVRVHLGTSAERSATEIGANAYTSGHNIVFAAGRFAPGTDEGRLLMAHELTHVVQQGASSQTVQRVCSPAATCAAPIAGSPGEFGASESAIETGPRARRKAMTPVRARSTGHAGRARQLEIVLEGHDMALRGMIHGIFIDHDLSSGTGAMEMNCAGWRVESLPAGDPDPDGFAAAAKGCVFVHGNLNQEALSFNNGDATVGGKPRDQWRTDTLTTLTHEVQHERFDTVIEPALPLPGAVATPTCTRASVESSLSEIASIVSEFPLRFNEAQAEANPAGPSHARLNNYFTDSVSNPSESFQGALTDMGCKCDCAEVDLLVVQAVNASTTGFTAAQKTAFRTQVQARMPGPGRPLWPATPT